MTTNFESILQTLQNTQKYWLVTGAAGFIGSNLVEFLLKNNQRIIGLDNFSTGYRKNLKQIQTSVSPEQWTNFFFMEADIRSEEACHKACEGVDYVLHQAALGSVPRSINDPITSNAVNITGFLNMLVAARDAKVSSFTFASSSSTYGDDASLPKVESRIGKPLSPYAITKYVGELYTDVFANIYDFKCIGLRYFNVFGPRQNRHGDYAAVIPKWITAMIQDEDIHIFGDGETCRDFCFIDNVVEANILAAMASEDAKHQIYNIALNDKTSLNRLFLYLKDMLAQYGINYTKLPIYDDFRQGDMKNSQADISKARTLLGYDPKYRIEEGLNQAMPWFVRHVR
jgi:UDP-N-acetylglucosamine 4-epimerase